ncbi:putative RNA-directed DNA polymerase, eukaryota, reverse transcriptase zinc-binding domain protein, partial [Tanacetum coccineum]
NKYKFPDLPSFAFVTNGIAKSNVDASSTNANIRALVLDDQDLINVEDPSMVLLVKLKDVNSMSNMKLLSYEKIRLLKAGIKQWHSETKTFDRVIKHDNLQLVKSIKEKIKVGSANDDDRDSRIKLLQEVDILDTFESFDLFQKTRILLKLRKSFSTFLMEKFKNHDSNVDFPPFDNSSGLCALDRDSLETPVSLDEVKKAVWDFNILEYVNIFLDTGSLPHGSNSSFFTLIPKGSNPIFIKDFCPISLIGVPYKIIAKILANRLDKVIDKIVSHEQSTFIVGRQILDGPLILSEIVEWFKKKKKKLLIFKVDFEKAFNSVSWIYLDFVLLNLGFGSKWRSYIRACLFSSRALVLVKGSPTLEFSIKRGLRQGDPLSPFLFILVMEGLHNAISTAVSSGLIRGVKFGSPELTISHLFYVDDMIITTEWNANDLENIICVLQWRWRLLSHKNALQVKVIKALHGQEGGFDNNGCIYNGYTDWSMRKIVLLLTALIMANDVGIGRGLSLELKILLTYSTCFGNLFCRINEVEDTCVWSLGTDGTLSVKDARYIIDSKILPSLAPSTVWDKNIPRMVNIFIWRLILDCLPHKLNISSRDIDIQMLVRKWCDISFPPFTSYEHWKDDDTSKNSHDYLSEDSSEDLINFLSSRDLQWQFLKQSHEEDPLPVDVPLQTREEDPLPLDIVYPIQEIASSSRDTSRRGEPHYGLRSLGPIQEEVVVVKDGCSGSGRKRNS